MTISCHVAGLCGGCPEILLPYQQQLANKRDHFQGLWRGVSLPENVLEGLEFISPGESGLRDRVEMTLHRVDGVMRFGLYDLDRKEIVDLTCCPQMSVEMEPWFHEFRSHLPQLELGAARLRVSPEGMRGLWLHFPNAEIHRFLEDGAWLSLWRNGVHVEMGQRRQTVSWDENGPSLTDPTLKPWFQTWTGRDMKPQALYCTVGAFTQPGFKANYVLVQQIQRLMGQVSAENWLELGSGIGNFTLPLAAGSQKVFAVENDRRAVAGLLQSSTEAGVVDRIQVEVINMHGSDGRLYPFLEKADAVLADPPRSGLGRCVDTFLAMPNRHKPGWFVYISCFAESMVRDLARLREAGYEAMDVKGVDQFPQSRHCEWIALLKLV